MGKRLLMRTSMKLVFAVLFVVLCSCAWMSDAAERKSREQRQEESLFRSLLNCPLCKGKEAVACFKRTRYEEGKAWRECLEECVDNPLIRSTFLALLPADTPKTEEPSDELKMPSSLEDATLRQASAGLKGHSEL